MFSVLVLTYNEEVNLTNCLASLPWSDDVWILDSGSTDRTASVATQLGANLVENKFIGYASQRNFGLSLPFKHEWIVMLDADERMTAELAEELEQKVRNVSSDVSMFRVRRKDLFMGGWLKRSSGYPTWFPRIFRRGCVRVEREINEEYLCEGRALQLEGHIEHYPLSKGVDWWFERHNRYSSEEARLLLGKPQRLGTASEVSGALMDLGRRRSLLKSLLYRLPLRPLLVFLYLYIVRLGFLDGRAGYTFCRMRLAYELMIDVKIASSNRQ